MSLSNFTAAQYGEPENIDLEYEVSLITPSKLSSFSTIQNVVQDSLGFLWVITNEGLHCLDGTDLVTYNVDSLTGQLGVHEQGDGYFRSAMGKESILWATEAKTNSVVGIDILSRKEVRRISIDGEYHDGNLRTLNNQETYIVYTDSASSTWLTCISCTDRKKKKLFEGKEVENYKTIGNQHWVHASSVFYQYDADGDLLNSFQGHPELHLNWTYGDSLTFYHPLITIPKVFDSSQGALKKDFEAPEVFEVGGFRHYTQGNEVWLSNLHHNFYIWNKHENTVQDYSSVISNLMKDNAPSGLSGEFKYELVLNDGSILYSRFNTLILFTKKKSDTDEFKELLSSDQQITSMRGLAEDENGNIFAAHYTAVNVKMNNSESFEEFRDTRAGKKEAERTYSLSYWNDKLVWDMTVFDLNSNSKSTFIKESYGQHVNHCLEGDTLWNYEWYTNNFVKYDLSTGDYDIISENLIPNTPIVSDVELEQESGHLWFATQYYGILVYSKKGELVHSFNLKTLGLPEMKSNIFFIEHEGDSVWFGSELGLGLLNKNTGIVQLFKNSISSENGVEVVRKMFSVLKDDDNNFYLGTNNGICFFDKQDLRFQNLIPKHPLAKIEFNRNSMLKASDGKFYFGSIDGLYSFFPDQLKFEDDLDVPKPFLASVIVFNKNESVPRILGENLNAIDVIRLKANETDLSVNFSAPSFENEVYYRYKIPKIKDEWSNYSTSNQLEFVSFPTGRHDIRVRTYLRSESDNFKEFSVTIFKPLIWYKRAWVILCLSLLGIALVSGLFWLRFRSVLRQKEYDANLRTKISSDLHDDVGSLLSGVALQSEVMSLGMGLEQKEGMAEISEMSRNAMERMRDIVWAIDSRKDKYENLIDRMRSFAEKNLNNKNIDHNFSVQGIDKESPIDPGRRQNIYLIFKESITNIIKHSDANMVMISFVKKGKQLFLSVHDNGSIKFSSNGDGLGLKNMEMRAEAIGGKLMIDSSDGYRMELCVLK